MASQIPDKDEKETIVYLNRRLKRLSTRAADRDNELKKLRKQLAQTQAQMLRSEKMASIGQLAAGVAHEINNPTGFIRINLNTLSEYKNNLVDLVGLYRLLTGQVRERSDTPTLIELSEIVEKISAMEAQVDIDYILADIGDLIDDCQEGANRIKKIVTDLKAFAHPGEDARQPVDINQCVESTLNVVINEIKYKAAVRTELGKIPVVQAYPQQLNQVFMNLLVNAAQAIDEKGEITITTRLAGRFVEVAVSDTGSGIPSENINRIFEPFFTTKEIGKGTGLGLHLAHDIVRKHHGEIKVHSSPGQGATFVVRIPAA